MKKKNFLKSIFTSPTSSSALLLFSVGARGTLNTWVEIVPTGTIKAKKKFSQDVSRLQEKKLIEKIKKDGKIMARLTDRGFVEFLKLKLIGTEELPVGLICMVIFDIPEKEGDLRKLFREFLDSNYFVFLQKSVWISFFDATEILSELVVNLGLEEWVKVYISKEVISST